MPAGGVGTAIGFDRGAYCLGRVTQKNWIVGVQTSDICGGDFNLGGDKQGGTGGAGVEKIKNF